MNERIDERRVLAKALIDSREHKGWLWAEDNVPPPEAQMYAVFDSLNIVGGGYSMDRVAGLVNGCEMPIVLYRR